MQSESTRRFEMGLPLFAGLDLGALLDAQAQIQRGEFSGLSKIVATLGSTGQLLTIRKLATIYTATDLELYRSETDPTVILKLEEATAERPFRDTFADAMDFQGALWNALGISPISSEEAAAAPKKTKGRKGKNSAGFPSEG